MAWPMEKSVDVGQAVRLPMVRDLVNQLSVIVGHCDLLSGHLKEGSQCAQRVCAIQEIAQGMAQALNINQVPPSEATRSARTPEREVA
jgi:hypothetical protein